SNLIFITLVHGNLVKNFFEFLTKTLYIDILQFDKGLSGVGGIMILLTGIVIFILTLLKRVLRPDYKKALGTLLTFLLAAVVISSFSLYATRINNGFMVISGKLTGTVLQIFNAEEETIIEVQQKNMVVKIGSELPFLFRNFGAPSVENIEKIEAKSKICQELWVGNMPTNEERKMYFLVGESKEKIKNEAGKEAGWFDKGVRCSDYIPHKSNPEAPWRRLGVAASIFLPTLLQQFILFFLIFITFMAILVLISRGFSMPLSALLKIKKGSLKAVWQSIVLSFNWSLAMSGVTVVTTLMMYFLSLLFVWMYSQGMIAVLAITLGITIGIICSLKHASKIMKVVKN
ncbi:MAG: hypothetical protein ACRC6X_04840, partial [Culicoidibacterales bacterium]